MTPLVEDPELVEKIQCPLLTNMDPSMDRDAKLDDLWDRLARVVNMFGEVVVKVYESNMNANVDYLEQPMPSS